MNVIGSVLGELWNLSAVDYLATSWRCHAKMAQNRSASIGASVIGPVQILLRQPSTSSGLYLAR